MRCIIAVILHKMQIDNIYKAIKYDLNEAYY